MDDSLKDLIDELIFSEQKIYLAYELPNGTLASLTNGDAEFMSKVKGNVIASVRPNIKPEGHNTKAQKLKNEIIPDDTTPDLRNESDLDVEKTFKIN
jgi:hypothetical protein